MPINDYRCRSCDLVVKDKFNTPDCPRCGSQMEVVFSSPPQVCFNESSVLEKMDEINNNRRKEIDEEDFYSPAISGDLNG